MALLTDRAFSVHGTFAVATGSQLVANACCPTMDLLALVHNGRLSLWRMQGGKVWDTDVENVGRVADLAWSPDGLVILCVHHPPRITLWSVHDGKSVGELPLPTTVEEICGAWWIEQDGQPPTDELADLMRRGPNAPGSAHSLLARLPLLDPYKDPLPPKPNPLGVATAFGLPEPKPAQNWYKPSPTIQSIPSLPPSPTAASLAPADRPPTTSRTRNKASTKDEQVDPNRGTLVVIADTSGSLHLYLDGSYAIGEVRLSTGTRISMSGLSKRGSITSFGVYLSSSSDGTPPTRSTSLAPTLVEIPLATAPETRKVARASSTLKALLEYVHLGVEELALLWCGKPNEGREGVKDAGAYWARIMLEKERAHVGRVTLGPTAQLTLLLLTGRATDSLQDFLGGGGKLTDRSVNHWEQVVSHALIKIRDNAGRRIAPAAERLVIVLEEIRGWAAWPDRFAPFGFSPAALEQCLSLAHRLVAYAQWLSIEANTELSRFVEFIKFMRSEIQKAIEPELNTRTQTQAQYDVLEAMAYIEKGFLDSGLTAWFDGPMPRTYPGEVQSGHRTMSEAVNEARRALDDARNGINENEGPPAASARKGKEQDQVEGAEHPERNLVALVGELAKECAEVCRIAAGAATRGAKVEPAEPVESELRSDGTLTRERSVVMDEHEEVYVATRVEQAGDAYLCLLRIRHEAQEDRLAGAVMKCATSRGDEEIEMDILDMAFFDDEALVLVVRARGRAFIATVLYRDVEYTSSHGVTREALIAGVMDGLGRARFNERLVPIARSRELQTGSGGALAVNGRRGRRMACVLDAGVLEAVDMEGEDDE